MVCAEPLGNREAAETRRPGGWPSTSRTARLEGISWTVERPQGPRRGSRFCCRAGPTQLWCRRRVAFAPGSSRNRRTNCGRAEWGLARGSQRCSPGSNSSRSPPAPALQHCGHLAARSRPPL
ncbi:OTU domain-containing protein 7A-like [Bubalus kerabau]|uniref:OTU domain-containing protein 7A-like n=1 Tax=Bubalus carabanensis TaxID=3119969 RepID=UPI00244E6B35|nr:OTU domain-containing protein 7A-like [Bubalus carabanensis]